MQITLGKRGDYAIRAVLDVARHAGGGRRKTREIADAMNIPPKYLSQILAVLVRQGIMVASAGRDGGYALARPASAISLLDVVSAVEDAVGIQTCLLRGIPCAADSTCAVHDAWFRAQDALLGELAAATFADLAGRSDVGDSP